MLIRDYGRRRLKELDEHNRRCLMKVSENVEKGGAVLKMVSSSTGFLKGMMELGGLVAAASSPAVAGSVNDGSTVSPELVDDDGAPPPPSQPANGPSFAQPPPIVGDAGRLGKGLAWLRERCRRSGAPARTTPSGGQADRYWWRRGDGPSTAATPNDVPASVGGDRTAAAATTNRAPTSPVRGGGGGGTGDGRRGADAGRGVFEKRAKWLKRSGRVADSDDGRGAGVDVGSATATAAEAISAAFTGQRQSDPPSAEKRSVEISVISDGQSNAGESPGEIGDGLGSAEWEIRDRPSGVEVVLDPVALTSTRTPLVAGGGQSSDPQTSVGVDHDRPSSAAVVEPPPLSPREPDTPRCADDGVHVVNASTDTLRPSGWSADDEDQSRRAPSSSDVDVLCSEIGRLVADYIYQHLASIDSAIYPSSTHIVIRFAEGAYIHPESKKGATLTMAITLSILGGFARFFHSCKDH